MSWFFIEDIYSLVTRYYSRAARLLLGGFATTAKTSRHLLTRQDNTIWLRSPRFTISNV